MTVLFDIVYRLDGVKERLIETSEEFENARKRAKRAKQTFEKVKKERYDRFMNCFDHVSNKIDEIYKVMLQHLVMFQHSVYNLNILSSR